MSLTIGVCAFNEERNVRALLLDVLGQTGLPEDVRIVVVASGCTDNTADIVRRVMKDNRRSTLIEEEARTGKVNAINQILATSPSGVLTLVDADVRLPQGTLTRMFNAFSDKRIGVAGGLPIVGNSEDSTISESASIILRIMTRALKELSAKGELSFTMGELYAFRTSLVQKIPDDVVNDDAYLATLVRSKGYRVVVAPGAQFLTRVPSSVSDYIAQRRRVTFGHMRVKAQMGRFATSMEGIALGHKSILVRAIVHEAVSHPMSILRALVVLELEVVAWLLAWLDIRSGRQHVLWKRIETTK